VGDQTNAPPTPEQLLFNEISHMDTVLFDAFNHRDLAKMKTLFTSDLEFYHDKVGVTNYQQNMDTYKQNFANPTSVRRELVEGSLEVYPIKDFGAVEIGTHRFYSSTAGQREKLTATAKFIHIWKKTNGEWKIARVISYDHR
jgi:ketosteroid isomerase-like protein